MDITLIALVTDILKAWGPPGIIALMLFLFLHKSEKREEAKDKRIQMLENLLIESYDERVAGANMIADAMHANSKAFSELVAEIRSRKR